MPRTTATRFESKSRFKRFNSDRTSTSARPELGASCLVDHTHSAAAQLLDYAVVGDDLPDHCGGPRLRYGMRMVGLTRKGSQCLLIRTFFRMFLVLGPVTMQAALRQGLWSARIREAVFKSM